MVDFAARAPMLFYPVAVDPSSTYAGFSLVNGSPSSLALPRRLVIHVLITDLVFPAAMRHHIGAFLN